MSESILPQHHHRRRARHVQRRNCEAQPARSVVSHCEWNRRKVWQWRSQTDPDAAFVGYVDWTLEYGYWVGTLTDYGRLERELYQLLWRSGLGPGCQGWRCCYWWWVCCPSCPACHQNIPRLEESSEWRVVHSECLDKHFGRQVLLIPARHISIYLVIYWQ